MNKLPTGHSSAAPKAALRNFQPVEVRAAPASSSKTAYTLSAMAAHGSSRCVKRAS